MLFGTRVYKQTRARYHGQHHNEKISFCFTRQCQHDLRTHHTHTYCQIAGSRPKTTKIIILKRTLSARFPRDRDAARPEIGCMKLDYNNNF